MLWSPTFMYYIFSTVPVVEREVEEPPPFIVLVQGPPGVGKTTLIKNLVKHYTRQNIGDIKGPVTLISGKSRRLSFIECPQVGYSVPGDIFGSRYRLVSAGHTDI